MHFWVFRVSLALLFFEVMPVFVSFLEYCAHVFVYTHVHLYYHMLWFYEVVSILYAPLNFVLMDFHAHVLSIAPRILPQWHNTYIFHIFCITIYNPIAIEYLAVSLCFCLIFIVTWSAQYLDVDNVTYTCILCTTKYIDLNNIVLCILYKTLPYCFPKMWLL